MAIANLLCNFSVKLVLDGANKLIWEDYFTTKIVGKINAVIERK